MKFYGKFSIFSHKILRFFWFLFNFCKKLRKIHPNLFFSGFNTAKMAAPAEQVAAEIENLKVNGGAAGGGVQEDEEDRVTPWEVTTTKATGIDYDKLIGTEKKIGG